MDWKKNDLVTVTIEDVGSDGEGIGKAEGYTLFVKDAVVGDTVEARIVKPKKNYAYARVEKLLAPSPFRVEPLCKFSRQCGGCQLQALSYEEQLRFKENKIRNNLIRLGGFDPVFIDSKMEPIIGMEEPFHYRNKAQYPIGTDREGKPIAGFYAGRTHSIIANTDCALGATENQQILEILLAHMEKFGISAYDERTGKGLIRHVLIRKGFTSGQLMVCIVLNQKFGGSLRQGKGAKAEEKEKKEFLPGQEELLHHLTKIQGMTSVSVSINTENTNVIMGTEIHTLWGEDTIEDVIHVRDMKEKGFPFTGEALTFQISPLSFYQVNPIQTEKLYSLALEYAGLTGKESVWDLYCGIGTISLFLAGSAREVYGVEIIPQAIADARKNAKKNGIENAQFFVGKAEEVLPKFYESAGKYTTGGVEEGTSIEKKNAQDNAADLLHPDVIVVDPPRKGCDDACLETMLKMQPFRIVYVSCDSATLARDLRILVDGGYEITRVRGVDQFANTVHVETVVLISKGDKGPADLCSARTEVERRLVDSRKVKVDLSLEDMDLSEFKGKATYEQIKAYVLEQTGQKVSSLYIAQTKKKCGLDVGENFNLPKSENTRQQQCTPEKEDAIMQAFKHFGIV